MSVPGSSLSGSSSPAQALSLPLTAALQLVPPPRSLHVAPLAASSKDPGSPLAAEVTLSGFTLLDARARLALPAASSYRMALTASECGVISQ